MNSDFAKAWYKSKTILFNMATAVVAIGNELAQILPVFPEGYQDDIRVWVLVAVSAANIFLRTVTDKPVRAR